MNQIILFHFCLIFYLADEHNHSNIFLCLETIFLNIQRHCIFKAPKSWSGEVDKEGTQRNLTATSQLKSMILSIQSLDGHLQIIGQTIHPFVKYNSSVKNMRA